MTDDDVQIFLTLKYSSIGKCVQAFRRSLGYPPDHHGSHMSKLSNIGSTMTALKVWVELGCPAVLTIPDDKVLLFIEFKYGSLEDAYDRLMSIHPGDGNPFTDAELKLIIDFVTPARN